MTGNVTQLLTASESVITFTNVSRQFGDKHALDNINLSIPRGGVFGLVGVNGAGKTTLIKHILGLLRAKQGQVEVFGLDPVEHPEDVLSRIGYMSEVTELPEWMRIDELIRYTLAFYPDWDKHYEQELIKLFEIDKKKKVRDLSKGQHARVALILALSHKPELLILDEPSSGLDPLVRRDILRTVIQSVAEEGRTVLFSSHLLEEVERIADHVAIIDDGKIIAQSALDDLKLQHFRLSVCFEEAFNTPPRIPNCYGWNGNNNHWTAIFQGSFEQAEYLIAQRNATILEKATPNLDEIFFALASDKHHASIKGL